MNQLSPFDQLVLDSQRPLLTALNTNLVLVVRSLRTEHPELEDSRGPGAEPPPAQRAVAASIVQLAIGLRALLDSYTALIDPGDRDDGDEDDPSF